MEIWVVINTDRMALGIVASFTNEASAKAYLESHGCTDWEEGSFIIDCIDTDDIDDDLRAG